MATTKIGGDVCSEQLNAQMLLAEPRRMTSDELDGLWRIFMAIGKEWGNIGYDSTGLKSSWLEFVTERAVRRPSYVAEYLNALEVVRELKACHGNDAFKKLFFESSPSGDGGKAGPPNTRLAHTKLFVVDEFIRVQVLAGGYRDFIRPPADTHIRPENTVNFNGFVSTSRFNRIKPVRTYEENL